MNVHVVLYLRSCTYIYQGSVKMRRKKLRLIGSISRSRHERTCCSIPTFMYVHISGKCKNEKEEAQTNWIN